MNIRNTALAALIFVFIYNLLFFQTAPGIGTGLFFLFLNIYFFLSRDKENHGNLNFALFGSGTAVLFAFLFAFRGNGIVQFIDLFAALFFSLTVLYFYKYNGPVLFKISNFIFTPFIVIERSVKSLLESMKRREENSQSSGENNHSSLIRGFVIALPVIIILMILLINADPIFGKLTGDIFKNTGERSIVSVILFIVLLGLGLSKFFMKNQKDTEYTISSGKSDELSVISGSIIALFTVFIFIQFRYLFMGVGERELEALGINSLTYSEYVRKGFFELLIAASIVSGIIIYIFRYLHHLKDRQKQLLQIFSAVLTVETGLLLLSAVKRLALYADAHGLTRARVFGFIFLIWLAVLLIIFLIRIYREMKEKEFFGGTVLATLLMFISVNIINIDGLIATKYPPTVNEEIDYYYLTGLSTDANDSWKESIRDSERIITQLESLPELSTEDNRKLYWTNLTIRQLDSKVKNILDKYGKSGKWQEFNVSEFNAYLDVINNKNDFGKIGNLSDRILKLEGKVSEETRRNTPLDRSTNPPLLR